MRLLCYRLPILLGAAWLAQEVPAQDPVGPKPHVLAADEAAYFMGDNYTSASFLELRSDGTFRSIDREHMFIGEGDAGRWAQTDNGTLFLCSEHRFQPLWSGDAHVFVDAESFPALPALREDVATLLATHDAGSFSEDTLKKALAPRSRELLGASKEATRADLEALLRQIDAYVGGGLANLERLQVREHRGIVYLLSDEPWMPEEGELVAQLDTAPGQRPPYVLFRIDAQAFARETGTTQPFLYHPEMNACARERARQFHDMKPAKLDAPLCGAWPPAGRD